MKIAVLGCGAIGGLFLGYLSRTYPDTFGVVKDYQLKSFNSEGVIVEGVRGKTSRKVLTGSRLKEDCDIAIFATKINDLEECIQDNLGFIKHSFILTTQNGIEADYMLSRFFPAERIITAVVMLGATFYPPNKITHNFEGSLALGNIFGAFPEGARVVSETLKPVFETSVFENIKGAKYLKLLINLNNCLPAALGLSMQEAFCDIEIAKLAILLNKEAYRVIRESGIELVSLPAYPRERIEKLVGLETVKAAEIFSGVMTSLSKQPLYGSIFQSIKRKKKSEIDYINGQIVKLASEHNLDAPLNRRIVELIHAIEAGRDFINKKDLFSFLEPAIIESGRFYG
ncbi:MAG: hypothetical protein GF375_05605 [Candidatus Omnitrophica bacterium]|nr:hypothetical protein [Candidatus Omnitrophota bacterium]MBD3269463.1 hypothetical protein [Candidatus Omnitrophota bacterium]